MLYWVTIGFSHLLTLRVNINVSPFMCIWAGTYIFPDASQTRSQLHRLLDMYDSVCRPSSTSFIPSASEDIVVANLFGHGLVIGTTCQDHPRRRTRIMEHLLAGLCAGGSGSYCLDVVQVCRSASVYPHAFFVACVVSSDIIGKIDARHMDCFTPLFAAGIQRNKRRAASVGAAHRLVRVRYMPYARETSYLLRVVNAEFERLSLFRLKAIAGAHHIETSGGEGVGWYQNVVSEHLFLGHCLSWVDSPIPEIPIGCLDFLAEFYFTHSIHN